MSVFSYVPPLLVTGGSILLAVVLPLVGLFTGRVSWWGPVPVLVGLGLLLWTAIIRLEIIMESLRDSDSRLGSLVNLSGASHGLLKTLVEIVDISAFHQVIRK